MLLATGVLTIGDPAVLEVPPQGEPLVLYCRHLLSHCQKVLSDARAFDPQSAAAFLSASAVRTLLVPFAQVLCLATSATLAMAARDIKTKDFSGWMKDYDSLTYKEERNAFLFFNEAKRGIYKKVILEEVVIYSRDGEANGEIAEKSTSYLAKGLADLLAAETEHQRRQALRQLEGDTSRQCVPASLLQLVRCRRRRRRRAPARLV